jgi:ribonuclease-3
VSGVLELLDELGVVVDAQLLRLALTHSSFAYENGRIPDNERLEFLGDAVLELVVTEHIYATFPDDPEGRLAKLRAAVVSAQTLAKVARSLGLGDELLLGKGELVTGGSGKSSLLADAMEAVIGAVFLSSGVDGARVLVHRLFNPLVAEAASRGTGLDWKTSLQELSARHDLGIPTYEVAETGPDHSKEFTAQVRLNDWLSQPGVGTSKKHAEQGAAESAFHELRAVWEPVDGESAD